MMTDFQSVCIGLEAAQALAFSDSGVFLIFQVQKSLPSLEVGPILQSWPFSCLWAHSKEFNES